MIGLNINLFYVINIYIYIYKNKIWLFIKLCKVCKLYDSQDSELVLWFLSKLWGVKGEFSLGEFQNRVNRMSDSKSIKNDLRTLASVYLKWFKCKILVNYP